MTLYDVGVFVIAIVMFILLSILHIPIENTASYYILSSISQGLAALLALVFTALLIMIQVFKRYSIWKLIMSPRNIAVILLFIIGIMFPLLSMRICISPLMVNICLSLCAVCILILIPLIVNIGKIMSGPVIYGELEQIILEAIEKKARENVDSYVKDFRDIWLSKIQIKDYLDLDKIWSIWLNINTRVRSLGNFETEIDVILEVCKKFLTTKVKEPTYYDTYASKVYSSFRLRLDYVYQVPPKVYDYYIQASRELFRLAIRKKYDKLALLILAALLVIAWQKWFKAGPIKDRDERAIVLIRPLLEIDKQYVKDALANPKIMPFFNNKPEIKKELVELVEKAGKE